MHTAAFNRYDNVKSSEEVMRLFAESVNAPKGGTDLTRVLRDALKPSEKAKSILVITVSVNDPSSKVHAKSRILPHGPQMPSDYKLYFQLFTI